MATIWKLVSAIKISFWTEIQLPNWVVQFSTNNKSNATNGSFEFNRINLIWAMHIWSKHIQHLICMLYMYICNSLQNGVIRLKSDLRTRVAFSCPFSFATCFEGVYNRIIEVFCLPLLYAHCPNRKISTVL